MERHLIADVAAELGLEREDVSAIIDEFMLQLHRNLFEYKGLNGDYVGEELHYQLGKQAFYHLLGFLDCFSRRYNWSNVSGSEYLSRLGPRGKWVPYQYQTEGWKERSV